MNKFYNHVQLLRLAAEGLWKTQYCNCSDIPTHLRLEGIGLRKYYCDVLLEVIRDIESLIDEEVSSCQE